MIAVVVREGLFEKGTFKLELICQLRKVEIPGWGRTWGSKEEKLWTQCNQSSSCRDDHPPLQKVQDSVARGWGGGGCLREQ